MCYFSTEGRSRDAREDEVLVVKRQHHGTNWLVSPDDHTTAVCIRDGTHLELLYIPTETRERFSLPPEITATFRQDGRAGQQRGVPIVDGRDSLVLADGRTIPLQKLQDGQVIKVASMPSLLQEAPPVRRGTVERLVSALVGAR